MIGRKLAVLEHEQISHNHESSFELPFLKEAKHLTFKNIKKYEHLILVTVLTLYVRFSNVLKNKYKEIKTKVYNKMKQGRISGEKKEISKFLRIMGNYKNKIREIKHRIKKGEDL